MRILWVVALSGALGVFGCSDSSDNGGTGGTAGSGGMAGAGGDAGTGGDMGTGGSAGETGGGGTGGSAGADGTGGVGGVMAPSALFCASYESTCGFGVDRYADADDCISSYEGYPAARQTCVETHLGFAEGGDTGLHCPHATGEAPCN